MEAEEAAERVVGVADDAGTRVGAAAGVGDEDADGLQNAQRLAQGGAADAEDGGEFTLGGSRSAGLELARDHLFLDALQYQFVRT